MKKNILLLFVLLIATMIQSYSQMIITSETFGTKAYDTDNPVPQPTGFAAGYNWYDVTTFSATNGQWIAGSDSSVRINNYCDGSAADTTFADGMHLQLTLPTRYSGSWDTAVLSGIDITNFGSLNLSLGFAKRNIDATPYRGLSVEYSIDGGSWTQLDSTIIPEGFPDSKWILLEWAIPGKGESLDIRLSTTRNQIAIDGLKLTGMPVVSITSETFGTKAYDTDNPVAQPTGFAAGYNWYDVTTFTATNGQWRAGSDSSIRINNYCDGSAADTTFANGMHLQLTLPTRYSGSWDTAVLAGIDITNFAELNLSLGYAKRNIDATPYRGLSVEYSIDGGAWTQLDSTLIPENFPDSKWLLLEWAIPGTGEALDIRLSTTRNQIAVDGIDLTGTPHIPVSLAYETFGEKAYDTDNPVAQPTGFAAGYNWYDVTTFTTTNGQWIAGSDSSIRINNYCDGSAADTTFANGMHAHLTLPTRYSGSWDTLVLSDINIANDIVPFTDFKISTGYAKRNIDATPYRGLSAEYRIDGGEWNQLDSTIIPNNFPDSKWILLEWELPEIKGDIMDIRFSTTRNQLAIDGVQLSAYTSYQGVPVDSIVITSQDDENTIDVMGGTLQLYAQVYPENASDTVVKWRSLSSFASVSSEGLVTALGNGDGLVTIEAFIGNTTGSFNINVLNQVGITGMSIGLLSNAKDTIIKENGFVIANVTFTPSNTSYKNVNWSLSNDTVVSIEAPYGGMSYRAKFVALKNGKVTITAISAFDASVTATKELVVDIPVSGLKPYQVSGLTAYPVPVTDLLHIDNASEFIRFEVTDLNGKTVLTVDHNATDAIINMNGLQKGLYLVRAIKQNGEYALLKITKE